MQSSGERAFETYWRTLAGDERAPVPEYKFSERKFRFDFAWPSERVAAEIEGGVWSRGRHTRAAGYEMDLEKYNLAASLEWRVFRYTPQMLARDPAACIAQIVEALNGR